MPLQFSNSISFVLSQDLATGQARVNDLTNWAAQSVNPADVEIAVGYIAPDGIRHRTVAIGQAGNIFPAVQAYGLYDLYRGADGKVKSGKYTFEFMVSLNGGESATFTAFAELCPALPAPCLKIRPDCLSGVVHLEDKTPLEAQGWVVSSRLLTLNWPSPTLHAPVTGAATTVSTAGEDIWTGTWTGTSLVTATKGNITVTFEVIEQQTVDCDLDGCQMLCMVKKTWEEYMRLKGSYPAQAAVLFGRLTAMGVILEMVRASVACGEPGEIDNWIAEFKKLATNGNPGDCGCGCSDDCDGKSKRIVPMISGGSAMWTPISSDNSVSILQGPGTYDFTVDEQLQVIINGLRNYSFSSPDGSVGITVLPQSGNTILIELTTTPGAHWLRFTIDPIAQSMGGVTTAGDSFPGTGITLSASPTAGFAYALGGIFPVDGNNVPQPFKVHCECTVIGRGIRPAYSNQYRYHQFVEPKISWDTTGSTPTILIYFESRVQPPLGNTDGQWLTIPYFSTWLSSMLIEVFIQRVD